MRRAHLLQRIRHRHRRRRYQRNCVPAASTAVTSRSNSGDDTPSSRSIVVNYWTAFTAFDPLTVQQQRRVDRPLHDVGTHHELPITVLEPAYPHT